MFGATDRLSLAASAIWRRSEWEESRHVQEARIEALAELGFTPESYTEALRARLAPDYPAMSYSVFNLLAVLEVQPMDEWVDDHTFVCTLGYEGHPGAEFSSLAYLKGA